MKRINRTTVGRMMLGAACIAVLGMSATPALGQAREGRGRGGEAGQQDGQRGERGQRGQRGGQRGFGGPGGMMGGGMGGMGGMQQMMQPYFFRRDLPLIVDRLELDDDQAIIVETLLLDYEASFEDAAEKMREEMAALRPGADQSPEDQARRTEAREGMRSAITELRSMRRGNQEDGTEVNAERVEQLREKLDEMRSVMRELRPQMPQGEDLEALYDQFSAMAKAWRKTRHGLETTFAGDLQLLLNEYQAPSWPELERFMRRDKVMRSGRLAGESVDLITIVEQLGLADSDRAEIVDLLGGYSVDLDAALIKRDTFLETSMIETMYAFMSGEMEKAVEIAEQEARRRIAVRSVNEQYSDALQARFTEGSMTDAAGDFRASYLERSYRRIYQSTVMQQSFDIVFDFEDVTEDTMKAIVDLEAGFAIELEAMNQELVYLTRMNEPKQNVERLERRAAAMNGGERGERPADPVQEGFVRRYELERRFRQQLESGLTEEQIAQLPELREPRGRGGRFGGRGGGGGFSAEDREAFRARMMERFDTNGDGELDDAERAAARETMRGGRGGRGGQGGQGGQGGRGGRGGNGDN